MASYFKLFYYFTIFIVLFSGCNDTKQSGTSKGNLKVLIEGRVVDGYIENATVFLDRNLNDKLDPNEPYTTTDDLGFYSLEVENQYVTNSNRIVAIGGRDTLLRQEFKSILRNTPTNTYHDKVNLTPATTLVGRYIKKTHSSLDYANQEVADFIGVSKTDIVKDPIEEANTNIALYKQNLKLHKVLESSAKYIFDDTTPRFTTDIADSFVPLMKNNKLLSEVETVKIERLNWDPKYIKPVSDRVQQVIDADVTNVHVDPTSTMYDELKDIVSTPKKIVNHKPVAVFDNFSFGEDNGTYNGNLLADDDDNDSLTYQILASPSHGNLILIDPSTGAFTYTPHLNFPNSMVDANDSFTYKATDEFVSSDPKVVNITVIAVNDPIVFTTPNHVSVIENNMSVMDVNVSDPDNEPITYSFTTAEANNTFNIDGHTGVITFKTPPDYELHTSYLITVRATESNRQNGNSYTQDINISIIDTNDESPILNPLANINVDENTIADTIIANVVFDQGDRNITDFNLSGVGSDRFFVENNGSIRVSNGAILDYEDNTSREFNLTLQASNGQLSNTINILINVIDIPDVVPTLQNFTVTIDENATLGSKIGDINITSHGDTNITLFEFISGDANFEVNSSGAIFIANGANLDVDTIAHNPKEDKIYNLTLKARNDFNYSSPINVVITVQDIADEAPILGDLNISLPEDKSAGFLVGTIPLQVGDWVINEANLTGVGHENFTIDTSGNIKVSVNANLDYESNTSYTLNARVLNDTSEDNATITIDITDIADLPPTLGSEVNGTISEDASADTIILELNVTDIGDRNITSYIIAGDTTGVTGQELFKIVTDGTNGILKLKNTDLDYERKTSYTLNIKAVNDAGNSNENRIVVSIGDIADKPPRLPTDQSFNINESQMIPFVFSSEVTHDNGDRVIDHFDLNDSSIFEINATGSISLKNNYTLDYERQSIYLYSLTATSISGVSNTCNITINIEDNNTEVGLELIKSIYDNKRTSNVADDILYIYFNVDVDTSSLDNPQTDYKINGNGLADSSSTDSYLTKSNDNNTFIYRYKIELANGSQEFEPYASKIKIENEAVKTSPYLQVPLTYNYATINAFNPYPLDRSYQASSDNATVLSTNLGLMWHNDIDDNGTYSGVETICRDLNYSNYVDWKMPNIKELMTLVNIADNNITDGLADSDFAKVSTGTYWTNSVRKDNTTKRWTMDFSTGLTSGAISSETLNIICVRNNNTQYINPTYQRVDSDEILVDFATNIIWQDNNNTAILKNKTEADGYCSGLNLGGFDSDWRLPKLYELMTIVNYKTTSPALISDIKYDDNGTYWSSSSYEVNTSKSWTIDFRTGDVNTTDNAEDLRVRCMRYIDPANPYE